MTCAACVRRVENALREIPGVQDASVNLATSRAAVSFSSQLADWSALKNSIEQAGYEYLGIYRQAAEDPADAARHREIADLKIKFTSGAVLSVVIMAGSMSHSVPLLRSIPHQTMLYILLLLSTPVVFWVGNRFVKGAIKATRQKTADMNTLVAIGSLSAYVYSAMATFFPALFH